MRGERTSVRCKDARQLGSQVTQAALHREAPLQQEGSDLINNVGKLTDASLAHPVQRLQIELVGGLGRDEPHSRALHGLGDGFRITEVILLSFSNRGD
jgi:hypothetical protein